MSFTFGGADAPSARGSQPRSSDLAELSRSRAGQAKDQMPLSFRRALNFRLVETSLDAADTSVCATSGSHSCGADSSSAASALVPTTNLALQKHFALGFFAN